MEKKEAMKILKDFYDKSALFSIRTALDTVIPELKESEDEKIRKELISHFCGIRDNCGKDWYGYNINDIIAWLEKQGKQKLKEISLWKHWKDGIAGNGEGKLIYLVKEGNTYRLTSCLGFECDYIELSELDKLMLEKQGENISLPKFTFDDVLALQCAMEAAKKVQKDKDLYEQLKSLHDRLHDAYWLEKQGEQNTTKDYSTLEITDVVRQALQECESFSNIRADVYAARVGATVEKLIKKQGEQKPAWSVEDENQRINTIELVKNANDCAGILDKETALNWLKSLKDRVQPKQEWSEEDKRMLNGIIKDLVHPWNEYIPDRIEDEIKWLKNKLKSLRPQNTWKPSEGQLECLGYAIEKAEKDWSPLTNNRTYLTLKALKEQLKQL